MLTQRRKEEERKEERKGDGGRKGGRKEESKEGNPPIYIDSLGNFNLSVILIVTSTCYHSTSGLNFKTFNIYIFEVGLLS